MATPVDFPKYLQSLVESYQKQQHLYTLTDLQVEVRVEISPEDRSPETPKNKLETKIDRLEVLSGIRKYLRDGNVVLVGKPGSGKSTVLQRFRWELAREALEDCDRPIPILVQLRSDRSIEQAICAEFRQAKLRVSEEEVKDWLLDDKLLLLLDGVNEIPSQQRRQEFQLFRDENSDTPMILTTRDLALGGSFGIEKKLEMCALTQPQMQEFVHKHLPQHGDSLLRQLRDRLREIAETPLLLKMMCEVFEPNLKIPQSKGELFQEFDRRYDKFKDVPLVSDNFRRFKPDLLQQLAFAMLQGDLQQPAEGLVAISRDRAEGILECWLRDRGVLDAPTKAKEWLEDLLEHHLLQVAAKPEEIEFHHQLFQEYYAGRALLKLLVEKHQDVTDDERLQHFYLNDFKWTEPLAFMLSLLGDEVQAVRVVRLALEVDVMLGARLAGEVQREFHKRAVGLVDGLDVPGWLKVALLGEVRSDKRISGLFKLVEGSDSDVRSLAAEALKNISFEAAIPGLLELLEYPDYYIRSSAAEALGNVPSYATIPVLLQIIDNSHSDVRDSVADALGKTGSQAAIPGLLQLLKDSESDVRITAADALGKIGSQAAIPGLLQLLKDSESDVRITAADALEKIGSQAAIPGLLQLLKDSESDVRITAADALEKIGSQAAIPGLLQLVKDSDSDVRSKVADALGKIGDQAAIPALLKLVDDSDSDVRSKAAYALGKIGDQVAIPSLLKLVDDSDSDVRSKVADALGKIGDQVAIPSLLKLDKDSDINVRWSAAYALHKIDSQAVRWSAAYALHKIDSQAVRWSVAYALHKIDSQTAIPRLLKLAENSEFDVRRKAIDAIANIAKQHTEKVAPHLPHLLTLIPSKSGKEIHHLILAIQAACKYYNYPIRQLSLTPQSAKLPQPNELLAKIDETTQQIHNRTKQMADKPTQDFSYSTFNAPFNFGDNHGNQAQNITIAAQQSSPEAALNAVVQIIQALEKKYTYVKDEEQALNIIDAEFKEIKEQKGIQWENLISVKRLYNGGKNAAVKVGEHFTESSVWGKAAVGFIEGVSEDVN
ncbi:MAG: HEAT repeat domain-containing protein [Microcoleus sp.]